MTTDVTSTPTSIDQESTAPRPQQKPYDAKYFGFADASGQRSAGLLVLLDHTGSAIQAELHFYSHLAPQAQRGIMRSAEALVTTRFRGGPVEGTPLYIFASGQQLQTITVNHTATEAPRIRSSFDFLPVAAVVSVLILLVVAILWALSVASHRDRTPTLAAAGAASAAVAANATRAQTATEDPTAQQIRTNDLPGSRNANPTIGVGMKVRILPELKSSILSQPGPDQGTITGYLQNGETATIIGGPIWLAGDSDTIVWWYVELPDGVRGWTPANTSTLTLLEPVQ